MEVEKKKYNKRSAEQIKNDLETKLNRIKNKIKKSESREKNLKRRETDHLKYTLAGNVLKIAGCDVRNIDLATVLGAIFYMNGKNKDIYKTKGLEILKEWNAEGIEGNKQKSKSN